MSHRITASFTPDKKCKRPISIKWIEIDGSPRQDLFPATPICDLTLEEAQQLLESLQGALKYSTWNL